MADADLRMEGVEASRYGRMWDDVGQDVRRDLHITVYFPYTY